MRTIHEHHLSRWVAADPEARVLLDTVKAMPVKDADYPARYRVAAEIAQRAAGWLARLEPAKDRAGFQVNASSILYASTLPPLTLAFVAGASSAVSARDVDAFLATKRIERTCSAIKVGAEPHLPVLPFTQDGFYRWVPEAALPRCVAYTAGGEPIWDGAAAGDPVTVPKGAYFPSRELADRALDAHLRNLKARGAVPSWVPNRAEAVYFADAQGATEWAAKLPYAEVLIGVDVNAARSVICDARAYEQIFATAIAMIGPKYDAKYTEAQLDALIHETRKMGEQYWTELLRGDRYVPSRPRADSLLEYMTAAPITTLGRIAK